MHETPIAIANVHIQLCSPLSPVEMGIEERLGPFFGKPETPACRVDLRWVASDSPPKVRGELIYDPGSIWKMYREGSVYFAAMAYNSGGKAPQPQSVLRANPAWDDLTLMERRSTGKWKSLLNIGAGELVFRTAIIPSGGLVFHSSAIDDNGKGVVFVGHAGAGKSTQAGLWMREPGVVAMNDDRVAVRMEGGGPMCYGTPWGGTADIARNHAAPLSALIVLVQAPENVIERVPPASAASILLPRAFLPYWDPELMARAMANLDALLGCVPVYRLFCRPESAVVPLVRSVL